MVDYSLLKSERGLTLFELLVVLIIISLSALIAIPAYSSLMQRLESQALKKLILEGLRRAKMESLSGTEHSIACLMNEIGQCDKLGRAGVMVFIDKNLNNSLDDADRVVYREALHLNYGKVSLHASLGRDYIKFFSDNGKPRGHFGHIRYCTYENKSAHEFRVVLNAYGIISERDGSLAKVCE